MHPYYEKIKYENISLPIVIYKVTSDGPINSIGQSINISNHSETSSYKKCECRVIPHWHNSLEILYFFKDGVVIIINGEEYHPKIGDIILIDAFDIHINTNETPDAQYVFLIDPSLMPINVGTQIQFPKLYEKKWLKKDSFYEPFRKIIANRLERVMELFQTSNNDNISKLNYYELYSEIFMLFAKLEDYLESSDSNYVKNVEESAHQRELLKKIYSFVSYNYHVDISLKEISELVGFTENYFCKFFKLSTNQTFLEFLNGYRCQMARNLMETTGETITTIALDCGFSSVSYFSKVFSKIYKINPRNYRNNFSPMQQ